MILMKFFKRFFRVASRETAVPTRPRALDSHKGAQKVKLTGQTFNRLQWLSGSVSDSYVCMASYLGPGFEPIWG